MDFDLAIRRFESSRPSPDITLRNLSLFGFPGGAGAEVPEVYLGLPPAAGEPPKRLGRIRKGLAQAGRKEARHDLH